MSFFLFTRKFIRFQILHSNWVRLNLFISCFIMVCLLGKVIVIIALNTDIFIATATNIHDKVSLNIECFKNFISFSPTLFTISGALLTFLHPNISMHFLHAVLYIFPNVLAVRIFLSIKRLFSLLFPVFS